MRSRSGSNCFGCWFDILELCVQKVNINEILWQIIFRWINIWKSKSPNADCNIYNIVSLGLIKKRISVIWRFIRIFKISQHVYIIILIFYIKHLIFHYRQKRHKIRLGTEECLKVFSIDINLLFNRYLKLYMYKYKWMSDIVFLGMGHYNIIIQISFGRKERNTNQ